MAPLNRRDFLKRGSMAVAAAGVASAVPMALPTLAGAVTTAPTNAEDTGEAAETGGHLDRPLVAHVRDLDTGEIGLFYGDHEVVYRDRKLAAQLHRAAT
jgi:hypothetical protein